jgi:hypothetical protein
VAKKKTIKRGSPKKDVGISRRDNRLPAGPKLLTAWLKAREMPILEFADSVDCCKQTISAIKNGAFSPGLALAVRIEKATQIPAASWVE